MILFVFFLWICGFLWFYSKDLTYFDIYDEIHGNLISSRSRVIVLRLPDAGLGNRLTASVSCIVLGILTKRAVFIDGGSYRFAKVFDPRNIQWDYDSLEQPFKTEEFTIKFNEDNLKELLCQTLKDNDGPVLIQTGQYFLPLLEQNPAYEALFRGDGPLSMENLFSFVLKRYFRPARHLRKMIDSALQDMKSLNRKIGIHFRDIYHTSEHKILQIECARYLAKHSVKNGFYIASDTLGWREVASQKLANDGKCFFNTLLRKKSEDDPQYRGDLFGIEQAVVDLYVLGAMDDLVVSAGSTFSYIAQALQSRAAVTVTREGKCVRALSASPVSGSFPADASDQPCWKREMWSCEYDQLCADPLCPISCGGKHERKKGETPQFIAKMKRKKLDSLSQEERNIREERKVKDEEMKKRAFEERPDFWKKNYINS